MAWVYDKIGSGVRVMVISMKYLLSNFASLNFAFNSISIKHLLKKEMQIKPMLPQFTLFYGEIVTGTFQTPKPTTARSYKVNISELLNFLGYFWFHITKYS